LATLRLPFQIAPIPGGRSDKPHDLGTLQLKAR